MVRSLEGGIIIGNDEDQSSLMGETDEELRAGVEAGVLYVCEVNDGTCPQGQHRGTPFLHYAEGKTFEDYCAVVDGPGQPG